MAHDKNTRRKMVCIGVISSKLTGRAQKTKYPILGMAYFLVSIILIITWRFYNFSRHRHSFDKIAIILRQLKSLNFYDLLKLDLENSPQGTFGNFSSSFSLFFCNCIHTKLVKKNLICQHQNKSLRPYTSKEINSQFFWKFLFSFFLLFEKSTTNHYRKHKMITPRIFFSQVFKSLRCQNKEKFFDVKISCF